MRIISIEGDDNINIVCNDSMRATLIALVNEKKITKEYYEEFLDNHILVFMDKESGWRNWMKRFFKSEPLRACVVVCKTNQEFKE